MASTRWPLFFDRQGVQELDFGMLREIAGLLVSSQERFHFRQHVTIVAAHLSRARLSLVQRTVEDLLEHTLHAHPVRCDPHGRLRSPLAVMRRNSQVRAVCQSRVTVDREIDSSRATSCSESPPK